MKDKKMILVTGANGQLAGELKEISKNNKPFNFLFLAREDLDISSKNSVKFFFENNKFDYCINTAAYTAVDKAETDSTQAMKINADAVKYLAEYCKKHETKLIHISTDFVFDGESKEFYNEKDITNPLSVYGKSKLKGEMHALQNNAMVIRTSWLYSTFGNNFLKTMLQLGEERDELNIISDQIGTPTYAKDLAEVLVYLIENFKEEKLMGLYHFSNDGSASWFDFAKEIFRLSGANCKANPIPTTEYPTPAVRPKFSIMDKSKIVKDFNIELIDWKVSLKNCLNLINIK